MTHQEFLKIWKELEHTKFGDVLRLHFGEYPNILRKEGIQNAIQFFKQSKIYAQSWKALDDSTFSGLTIAKNTPFQTPKNQTLQVIEYWLRELESFEINQGYIPQFQIYEGSSRPSH